ncbi:MAG: ABC transporter ATP-binding protein/permease [Vicinamibacterales bacterium]|nr:ABC transporter ATP-binding protein/permease [Vicinamibacterales bacterium]
MTRSSMYRRLAAYARPYWPQILIVLILQLLATPLALLGPVPLKIAVDTVIGSRPLPGWLQAALPASLTGSATMLLGLAAALLVLTAVLGSLLDMATGLLQTYTGEKLAQDFRSRLFRHVQRLSLSYHDMTGTSDSTYRIQYDAPAIQRIVVDGLIPLFGSAVTLVAMIVVTARIDLRLAVVALAVSPILFLLSRSFGPRLRKNWKEIKQLDSSAMGVVQEVLSAVRVVKAFGREDREHERFLHQSNRRVRRELEVSAVQGSFDLLVALVMAGGSAAALLIGVQQVRAGQLSLGSLLLVMAYLQQIYKPLRMLSKKTVALESSMASAERAFALLDKVPDVAEKKDAHRVGRSTGSLLFLDVSFAYDADHTVLHRVSFAAPPGTRVGIRGTTGAGKSSLMGLLMRFYDPTDGQILLDGVDLRDYNLGDLRRQFGIVLQEPVLFSSTIGENIAYGRPEATREQIAEAARLANAHEFISALPEGYDTTVGERGMRLSGGERQRISLARAFLLDAPILILDEPTSSVDVKTEAVIIEAMNRLMEGRTTFLISHRLDALTGCDMQIELEKGWTVFDV